MTRLGAVFLAVWMVACGGSQPAAEEPVAAAPPMSEPPPAPPKAVEPREEAPIAEGPQEEQWAPDEYDEEYGVEGGIEGGVVGGVVGGTLGGSFGGPPPPPPPPPPNQPQIVPQIALEQQRIAGDKHILPPDEVRLAMKRANQSRLVTTMKMCLDANGSVESVLSLKSSGYPSYDTLLATTIKRTWKYRPFTINGKAVPVCTSVTFIYNQRNPDPDAGN